MLRVVQLVEVMQLLAVARGQVSTDRTELLETLLHVLCDSLIC